MDPAIGQSAEILDGLRLPASVSASAPNGVDLRLAQTLSSSVALTCGYARHRRLAARCGLEQLRFWAAETRIGADDLRGRS